MDITEDDLELFEEKAPLQKYELQTRMWDSLIVDDEGRLQAGDAHVDSFESEAARRKRELRGKIRGLIRVLVVAIDLSERGLSPTDLEGNRLSTICRRLKDFVVDFFDQNPLSQMAIIATHSGTAHYISHFSGDPKAHIEAIDGIEQQTYTGEPSLYHLLSQSKVLLKQAPVFATKEVLVIYGALSTCDPVPLDPLIKDLVKERITVSVIGLGAELYILSRVTNETGGSYFVPVSSDHFADLMNASVQPPSKSSAQQGACPTSAVVSFGFPLSSTTPAYNIFELKDNKQGVKPKYGALVCPKCGMRVFNIPVYCPVCQILLISPAHVTRSLHQLHPVEDFEPLEGEGVCNGCNCVIESGGFKCTQCNKTYCKSCDKFIHDNLQNCPGCLALS